MLTFKDFVLLSESIDKPYQMNLIPDRYIENTDGTIAGYFPEHEPELGLYNRKLYSIGDAGYVTTYERNGATEIHHYDKQNLTSAGMISDPTKQTPNPRFVATMFHHAKHLIDNEGKSVRVVGRIGSTAESYHRLAKILAKRYGYSVSDMTPSEHNPNEIAEFTIGNNTR